MDEDTYKTTLAVCQKAKRKAEREIDIYTPDVVSLVDKAVYCKWLQDIKTKFDEAQEHFDELLCKLEYDENANAEKINAVKSLQSSLTQNFKIHLAQSINCKTARVTAKPTEPEGDATNSIPETNEIRKKIRKREHDIDLRTEEDFANFCKIPREEIDRHDGHIDCRRTPDIATVPVIMSCKKLVMWHGVKIQDILPTMMDHIGSIKVEQLYLHCDMSSLDSDQAAQLADLVVNVGEVWLYNELSDVVCRAMLDRIGRGDVMIQSLGLWEECDISQVNSEILGQLFVSVKKVKLHIKLSDAMCGAMLDSKERGVVTLQTLELGSRCDISQISNEILTQLLVSVRNVMLDNKLSHVVCGTLVDMMERGDVMLKTLWLGSECDISQVNSRILAQLLVSMRQVTLDNVLSDVVCGALVDRMGRGDVTLQTLKLWQSVRIDKASGATLAALLKDQKVEIRTDIKVAMEKTEIDTLVEELGDSMWKRVVNSRKDDLGLCISKKNGMITIK